MKHYKFLLLLFAVFMSSCAHQNNKTVIIRSSEPADSIFTEINLATTTEQTITFEGGKTCRFDIDTVEAYYFSNRSNGNYFFTRIFITPGDSVSFRTIAKEENSYEVIFEGKNAAHYNYASLKRQALLLEKEPDFFLIQI